MPNLGVGVGLLPITGEPLGRGNIAGTVYDTQVHPYPGVNILACPGGRTDVSDVSGHFHLPAMPVGTYTLKATKDTAFSKTTSGIVVEDGKLTTISGIVVDDFYTPPTCP